jgi:hypothetical protein
MPGGLGVADDETIDVQLSEALQRLDASAPAEVINLAVIGYGTDQEYLMLLTDGLRYAPDDIVLEYFHENDAREPRRRCSTVWRIPGLVRHGCRPFHRSSASATPRHESSVSVIMMPKRTAGECRVPGSAGAAVIPITRGLGAFNRRDAPCSAARSGRAPRSRGSGRAPARNVPRRDRDAPSCPDHRAIAREPLG